MIGRLKWSDCDDTSAFLKNFQLEALRAAQKKNAMWTQALRTEIFLILGYINQIYLPKPYFVIYADKTY